MTKYLSWLRRSWLTIGYLVVFWVLGIASGTVGNRMISDGSTLSPLWAFFQDIGTGVPALHDGHWWSLLTSMFYADGVWNYITVTVVYLALVLPAERALGTWRTGALLLGSQLIGALAGSAIIDWTKDNLDWSFNLSQWNDLTPTAGAVGVGLAWSATCTPLWRRRIRLTTGVGVGMLLLYLGGVPDVVRVCAAFAGLALGVLLVHRPPQLNLQRSSISETRVLLALIVAATALGPILAAFSSDSFGLLFNTKFVFWPEPATVTDFNDVCPDPNVVSAECLRIVADIRSHGLGQSFLSLLPVILSLVVAEGLRRGRRLALRAGILLQLGLSILSLWSLNYIDFSELVSDPSAPLSLRVEAAVAQVVLVLQGLIIAILLIANRHAFRVSTPRPVYRQLLTWIGVAGLISVGGYLGIGYAVRTQFMPTPSLWDLVKDLPTRFIPPGYLYGVKPTVWPDRPVAYFLYNWTGVLPWAILLIGGLLTYTRFALHREDDDLHRVRELLRSGGGSPFAHMVTWEGNTYWFSPDGKAAIAYRTGSGVALTVGEPIGEPQARRDAIGQFAEFCRGRGLVPCFYSVTDTLGPQFDQQGWKLLQVAEETSLQLATLAFTGKKWQDIRTALNKAGKQGITAEWISYPSAPLSIVDQIRAISEEWVVDKAIPEMGFTLGSLRELDDPEVRCLIAVDGDRTVHGVTSWMPVYSGGQIVGWTLDFMRRRTTGFIGVMEFLIASAALQFKEDGVEWLSLSGAPLARVDRSAEGVQATALQKMLDRVGAVMEPLYGFRSLLAFKAKFQPLYQPIYLTYPESVALPSIGTAVTNAYLPSMSIRERINLLKVMASKAGKNKGPAKKPVSKKPAPAQPPEVPAARTPQSQPEDSKSS
ncbi:rhomboid family intramembrane serine protease [Pseudonocardiaceae bacterium YIM PH 21723]|nr:rhomboid family intramembrane serine protease [Pseudonocardiaceae bacterium YIM PH 21723]